MMVFIIDKEVLFLSCMTGTNNDAIFIGIVVVVDAIVQDID